MLTVDVGGSNVTVELILFTEGVGVFRASIHPDFGKVTHACPTMVDNMM
jgi:hypothetical protein